MLKLLPVNEGGWSTDLVYTCIGHQTASTASYRRSVSLKYTISEDSDIVDDKLVIISWRKVILRTKAIG